jgi:hypothetical protein
MRRSLNPDSPVERYFGAEEQVRILQEKLELTEYEHAVIVAAAIRVCVWQSMKQKRAREAISDIKDARRSVAQIETTARKLARLLDSSPLGRALVHKPGSIFDENYGVRDEEGILCLSETYEAERAKLQDFINTARVISSVAAKLLKDEVSFRALHDLPPSWGAGKSAVAFCLWPQLFEIWSGWAGKPIGKTADGALHKFVSFVHEACDLPEVPASTFRDAVTAWKVDQRRQRRRRHRATPPWRS